MPNFRGFEDYLTNKLTKQANSLGEYYTGNEDFDKIAARWNRPDIKPQLTDFIVGMNPDGLYPREEVVKDAQVVQQIKQQQNFVQERNAASVAFEYIAKEGIHDELWFGDGVSVFPTAEYDDFVNGIDFVVKFEGDEEPFYLGVDSTAGQATDVIYHKLERNAEMLSQREPFQVKYFHDIDTGEKRQLALPRIVIGVHWEEVDELTDGFTRHRKDMQHHQLQIDFLKQAVGQLTASLEYLIQQNLDETFDIDKEDWHQVVELTREKLSGTDLGRLITLHTKPLEHLQAVLAQKKSLGLTKGLNESVSHLSDLYAHHLQSAA